MKSSLILKAEEFVHRWANGNLSALRKRNPQGKKFKIGRLPRRANRERK